MIFWASHTKSCSENEILYHNSFDTHVCSANADGMAYMYATGG